MQVAEFQDMLPNELHRVLAAAAPDQVQHVLPLLIFPLLESQPGGALSPAESAAVERVIERAGVIASDSGADVARKIGHYYRQHPPSESVLRLVSEFVHEHGVSVPSLGGQQLLAVERHVRPVSAAPATEGSVRAGHGGLLAHRLSSHSPQTRAGDA